MFPLTGAAATFVASTVGWTVTVDFVPMIKQEQALDTRWALKIVGAAAGKSSQALPMNAA